MKQTSYSILFFIKKAKLLKNGEAPIFLRITVDGVRAENGIQRSVTVNKWDNKKGEAIGKEHNELNLYLATIRTKLYSIYRKLEDNDEVITAHLIQQHYLGKMKRHKMLLEEFQKHNKQCRELIGKDYATGTVTRFERTVTYLSEYLQKEYEQKDIPFKNINPEFITGFEHYIKANKGCDQNTTVKYLANLKKIIRIGFSNGWIDRDPYVNIKLRRKPTNREFLLEEEVQVLINKQFEVKRLEVVRDIFIFCCFTGLAFIDIKYLTHSHITKDNQGEYWIRKPREKTNNMSNVPLLEIPLQIIEKYRLHHDCESKGIILPVPSNQRMNSYLKEIADLCGIKKNLSTHIARHTFACLALANNITIDSISKMLGHTDLRTTRIYARVLDKTISTQMKNLSGKFTL